MSDLNINSVSNTNKVSGTDQEQKNNKQVENKKQAKQSIFIGDKNGNGIIDRNDFSDSRSWRAVLIRGLSGKSWSGNEKRISDYTYQYESRHVVQEQNSVKTDTVPKGKIEQ